jgi:hypothetical protein
MMRHRNHGVVLIMVIAILATLALAGTAFLVVMGQESKAASSTLYLAQAELAARSGLEHAVGVIDKTKTNVPALVITPDGALDTAAGSFSELEGQINAGWHRYFEQGTADPVSPWILHYFTDTSVPFTGQNEERYGATAGPLAHETRGRVIPFPSGIAAKRGEYAVCVTDLDGKLHANIAAWKGGLGGDGTGALVDLGAVVAAVAKVADPDDTTDPDDIFITDTQATRLGQRSSGPPFSSLSEVARRADVMTSHERYALERFFTVYPIPGSDGSMVYDGASVYNSGSSTTEVTLTSSPAFADGEVVGMAALFLKSGAMFGIATNVGSVLILAGNCEDVPTHGTKFVIVPRPAVNVNTAPEALLAELFKPPMRLVDDVTVETNAESEAKAVALAKYLCSRRPFVNRSELEDAIFLVVGNQNVGGLPMLWPGNGAVEQLPGLGTGLTERQFNDCLNSIAGVLAMDESAFDEPANPGVYSFDGWEPYQTGEVGPSQTLGACSDRTGGLASGTGVPEDNVTWSTELKFNSRFFHIYVVGRAWNENAGEATGVKRLHAIYDSRAPAKIIWLRWNLSSRGSLTDM